MFELQTDTTCIATFEPDNTSADRLSLHLGTNGAGDISVTKDATPVACPNDVCAVDPGTTLRLEATAGAGNFFSHWSSTTGDCAGTDREVTVTLSADADCTANFETGVQLEVAVQTDDQAMGRVVAAQGATIDCAPGSSTGCVDSVRPNSQVTLRAMPIGDTAVNIEWSGDCAGMDGPEVTVAVDRQTTCVVRFSVPDLCGGVSGGPTIQLSVRHETTQRVVMPQGDTYRVVTQSGYQLSVAGSTTVGPASVTWNVPGTRDSQIPNLRFLAATNGSFPASVSMTDACGTSAYSFTLEAGL